MGGGYYSCGCGHSLDTEAGGGVVILGTVRRQRNCFCPSSGADSQYERTAHQVPTISITHCIYMYTIHNINNKSNSTKT